MVEYSAHTEIYLHLVWSTWDRLDLITPAIEPRLYSALEAKCVELNCGPVTIGGIANHVHLLVRIQSTISVAQLVKELKGSSSHLVTHEIAPDQFFKWQGSYAAFSVDKSSLDRVRAYIENQKQHHTDQTHVSQWEN
jgi:REP element-mobilizing transposase RayT